MDHSRRNSSIVAACVAVLLGLVGLIVVAGHRGDAELGRGKFAEDVRQAVPERVEAVSAQPATRQPLADVFRFFDKATGQPVPAVQLVPAEKGRAFVIESSVREVVQGEIPRSELEGLLATHACLWAVAEGYEIAEIEEASLAASGLYLSPARMQSFRWLGMDDRPIAGKKFTVIAGTLPGHKQAQLENVPSTEPRLRCRTAFTGWTDAGGRCRIAGLPDLSYHVSLTDHGLVVPEGHVMVDLPSEKELVIRCAPLVIAAVQFTGLKVNPDSLRFQAEEEDLRYRHHPALNPARRFWSARYPEAFVHLALARDPQIDEWDVTVEVLDEVASSHDSVLRAVPASRFRGPEVVELEPAENVPAPGHVLPVVPVAFRGWDIPVSFIQYEGRARRRLESRAGVETALPPGDYEIHLLDEGWFGPLFLERERDITVVSGETLRVEFEAKEVPRHFRLRLDLPLGDEPPPVRIVARRLGERFAAVFMGRFTQPFDIYLPPGRFDISFHTKRYGFDYLDLTIPQPGHGPMPEPTLVLEPVDHPLEGMRDG